MSKATNVTSALPSSVISIQQCARHFNVPIEQAALNLGVSRPTISKLLRRHGISRWPFRKLSTKHNSQKLQQWNETMAAKVLASLKNMTKSNRNNSQCCQVEKHGQHDCDDNDNGNQSLLSPTTKVEPDYRHSNNNNGNENDNKNIINIVQNGRKQSFDLNQINNNTNNTNYNNDQVDNNIVTHSPIPELCTNSNSSSSTVVLPQPQPQPFSNTQSSTVNDVPNSDTITHPDTPYYRSLHDLVPSCSKSPQSAVSPPWSKQPSFDFSTTLNFPSLQFDDQYLKTCQCFACCTAASSVQEESCMFANQNNSNNNNNNNNSMYMNEQKCEPGNQNEEEQLGGISATHVSGMVNCGIVNDCALRRQENTKDDDNQYDDDKVNGNNGTVEAFQLDNDNGRVPHRNVEGEVNDFDVRDMFRPSQYPVANNPFACERNSLTPSQSPCINNRTNIRNQQIDFDENEDLPLSTDIDPDASYCKTPSPRTRPPQSPLIKNKEGHDIGGMALTSKRVRIEIDCRPIWGVPCLNKPNTNGHIIFDDVNAGYTHRTARKSRCSCEQDLCNCAVKK